MDTAKVAQPSQVALACARHTGRGQEGRDGRRAQRDLDRTAGILGAVAQVAVKGAQPAVTSVFARNRVSDNARGVRRLVADAHARAGAGT